MLNMLNILSSIIKYQITAKMIHIVFLNEWMFYDNVNWTENIFLLQVLQLMPIGVAVCICLYNTCQMNVSIRLLANNKVPPKLFKWIWFDEYEWGLELFGKLRMQATMENSRKADRKGKDNGMIHTKHY